MCPDEGCCFLLGGFEEGEESVPEQNLAVWVSEEDVQRLPRGDSPESEPKHGDAEKAVVRPPPHCGHCRGGGDDAAGSDFLLPVFRHSSFPSSSLLRRTTPRRQKTPHRTRDERGSGKRHCIGHGPCPSSVLSPPPLLFLQPTPPTDAPTPPSPSPTTPSMFWEEEADFQ